MVEREGHRKDSMRTEIYTDDDIDMANATNAEYITCAKCEVDMPVESDPTVNPNGRGYLCPFCDGTF